METILIAVGALAVLWYFNNQNAAAASQLPPTPVVGPGLVPTYTPAPPVPMALPVASPGPVPSSYQVVPASTALSAGSLAFLARNPSGTILRSPARLGAVVPSTPGAPPPPYVSGGIGGGIGTGGNPLGSNVRPGISSGTATTSIPTLTPVIS